jgi:hypothetical protein
MTRGTVLHARSSVLGARIGQVELGTIVNLVMIYQLLIAFKHTRSKSPDDLTLKERRRGADLPHAKLRS